MIPITPQPEPLDFDKNVRIQGQRWLKSNPGKKPRSFWTEAQSSLWKAYNGICAYTCHWIPLESGCSVDHYEPISKVPQLAYEWSNFRLASQRINSRKGDSTDVLDPFKLTKDWFVMVFPGLLVKPNPNLSIGQKRQVQATIDRLKLNKDEDIKRARLNWILEYCQGKISFEYLKDKAPFIAYELKRNGLEEDDVKSMFLRTRKTSQVIASG